MKNISFKVDRCNLLGISSFPQKSEPLMDKGKERELRTAVIQSGSTQGGWISCGHEETHD